jgi:hypothetical protein
MRTWRAGSADRSQSYGPGFRHAHCHDYGALRSSRMRFCTDRRKWALRNGAVDGGDGSSSVARAANRDSLRRINLLANGDAAHSSCRTNAGYSDVNA